MNKIHRGHSKEGENELNKEVRQKGRLICKRNLHSYWKDGKTLYGLNNWFILFWKLVRDDE
jgi:hypothetical protein